MGAELCDGRVQVQMKTIPPLANYQSKINVWKLNSRSQYWYFSMVLLSKLKKLSKWRELTTGTRIKNVTLIVCYRSQKNSIHSLSFFQTLIKFWFKIIIKTLKFKYLLTPPSNDCSWRLSIKHFLALIHIKKVCIYMIGLCKKSIWEIRTYKTYTNSFETHACN